MRNYWIVLVPLIIALLALFFVSHVDAGLPFVRAQYPFAKHCYPKGNEPKTMVHKVFYPSFQSCQKSLKQSEAE